MNNFQTIHLSHAGFSLFKVNSVHNIVFNTHKSASFTSLQRECGIFFGADLNGEMHVIVHPTPPVLVPRDLYQSPANQYLTHLLELSDNDAILEDLIADYVVLYPFPQSKIIQLQNLGITPTFHHISKLLYDYLMLALPTVNDKMLLFLSGNIADFVLVKDNQLQLVNSFKFSATTDLLYFILNILKQFEMSLTDTQVLLSGVLPDAKKSFPMLETYIPQLRYAGENETFTVANLAGACTTISACLPEFVLFTNCK